MRGRLRIEFGAADGSAAGDKFDYTLVMDVTQHGMSIDQNGTVALTIMGRLPAPVDKGETMTHISHGATAIVAERRRQIEAEGWTPEHDDEHISAQLIDAANCYLFAARWCLNADDQGRIDLMAAPPAGWPWDRDAWKPSMDQMRNLVKAGALIAAEIDRLHRATVEASQGGDPPPRPHDVARSWRTRDWPGQGSSNPPDWYLDLWRSYVATDEGRRRYPDGVVMPDGTIYTPTP